MAYLATFEDGTVVQSLPAGALPQSTVFTYNNVKLCLGPQGKTAFDKYDLDGNHWEITVSNSLLAIFKITSPDGVVIYTNSVQASGIPNPKYYDDNKYYFVYMLIENTSGDISYLAVTLYGGGSSANGMDARGVNGVTQVTNNGTYVPFPQDGFWDAGLQVQRAFTYALANPSAYNAYAIYNIDENTGVNTFYLKNSVFSFNESRKLPRATIVQYFSKTFSINSGDLNECTITLNRTTFFYTGSAIKPEVTVTTPTGIKLDELVDYTLSYFDNVNIGTGQVLITGNNLWTGTARKYFQIVSGSDPFSGGGISTTGGGGGTFDNETDEIPVPDLPNLSSLNSKFVTLWVPTLGQLQNFSEWMWTNTGLVDSILKIYANPIDYILGLHIVPVDVSYADYIINIGNISSGVTMRRALNQYNPVDCGYIKVDEYWGAYLDFSPYTKLQLYLPFVGFIQLDADSVVGRTLGVKYNCDILSGACVAFVTVDNTIAYTFTGNFAAQIPISNNDMSRIVGGTFTGVGTGVGLGLKAATALGAGTTGIAGGIAAGLAGGIASGVLASKQQVGRSGTISSTAGLLGVKKPYLIIDRPRQAMPENQNRYTGYPGFITVTLSNLSGFTKIEEIHLDNVPATDSEIEEILEILHSGFII